MKTRDHCRRIFVLSMGIGLVLTAELASAAQRMSAKAAIAAANKEFEQAYNKGDYAAIAAQYSKDSQSFPRLEPTLRGKEDMVQYWKRNVPTSTGYTARLKTKEVQEAGDWAYEVGEFLVQGKKGQPTYDARYILIWKFEDGKWRIHRELGSENFQDVKAQKAAIEATEKKWIDFRNKQDAAALAGLYADDAVILPADQDPVQGRSAIEAYYRKVLQPEGPKEQDQIIEIQIRGDLAYESGTFTEKTADGKVAAEGKYMVIWKLDDGAWKIYRETFNTKPEAKKL